jgi:putative ABC transport system permease protein
MRALRVIRLRIRSLFHSRRIDQELDAELREHLERQVQCNLAAGLSPHDARHAALREFGNLPLIQEQVRDMRRVNWIEDLRRDLAYAIRSMRRAPGYTAVAALSLALAIGANTAIFSLVNVLMLRDLPVRNPHELVEIGPDNFSYPFYEEVRDQNTVFSDVLAISSTAVRATIDDAARLPIGRFVSGNVFQSLGLSPAVGRLLSPDDDRFDAAEGSTLTVIGYELWQHEFGGDRQIIGRTLTIETVPFTIVGVLPRTFDGVTVGRRDDFFIPIASEPRLHRDSWLRKHAFGWLKIVGRLESATPQETAKADLQLIFRRYVEDTASSSSETTTQRRARADRLTIESARAGLSAPRREFLRPVLLLMGAVGLVLFIACANVVTLLLARGMARRREIGLRLAIGASRGRLVRQLLTETAALGLLGGAIGFAVATWGTRLLAVFIADGDPTISFDIAPDSRVLAFTGVISLGSALVAGLVPALRATRTNVTEGMRHDGRTLNVSRSTTLWTRMLIAAQVALSLLLLTGASLLIASLRNLREFDAGFDRDHVFLMGLSPDRAGYTGDRQWAYYRQVLERARNTPGVRAAALSLMTPISGGLLDQSFGVQGRPPEPGVMVYANHVSEGYFAALGTTVLLGRDFRAQDGSDATPVAVINDALSKRYFKNENPIGQRVRLGRQQALEIVGVVANAKYVSLREENQPTMYIHALQKPDLPGLTLVVRTAGDPMSVAPQIRREVKAISGTVPITQGSTLSAQIDRSLVKERFMTRLLGGFAALALLLASVGLYGALGYAVTRRTNEIGIRLALGATRGRVLRSVLRESSLLVAIGVAVGAPAALALSRLLSSLLYGVAPTDPWVLGGSVAALFVVALTAAAQPAWRAMRVDPLIALRYE